jgi:hypothetical protein
VAAQGGYMAIVRYNWLFHYYIVATPGYCSYDSVTTVWTDSCWVSTSDTCILVQSAFIRIL